MVVVWLTEAENDVQHIYSYLKREAGERTAKKITDRIREYAEDLGAMPLSAPVELLLEDRPEGYRSKVVKSQHKIVYTIIDGKVNVVTVFDCRRDPALMREIATGK